MRTLLFTLALLLTAFPVLAQSDAPADPTGTVDAEGTLRYTDANAVEIGSVAEAAFLVGLVVLEVAFEEEDFALALKSEHVRRHSIEEPAVV